jgi:hypothetical protein
MVNLKSSSEINRRICFIGKWMLLLLSKVNIGITCELYQIQEDRLYRLLRVIISSVKTKSFFGTHYVTKNLTLNREHHGASFLKIDGSLPVKAMFCFLFYFIYLHIHRLIDWLVFNANFSSISAILWRFISIQLRCLHR